MIERFNGRIETLIKKTQFKNSEELKLTIFQYQDIYNKHIAQRALDTKTPQETVLIY